MSKRTTVLWLLGLLAASVLVVLMAVKYSNRLYFDSSGVAHGTGTKHYHYQSGQLKQEDRYVDGVLVEETWYRPDGTVFANETFVDGCGVGYYLREDGSPRVKMPYVNGLAEGTVTYYSTNGEIERTAEFKAGQEVKN
ncbi:MAG TPA: hypothetical protein PKN33_05005 [Phycisphaerae bacterium]|nr:hypothetical protein [Phycisphaerae bacterium]